jgi:hypothetical protein
MTKRKFEIKTPRGQVVTTKAGKARLEWNINFAPKMEQQYSRAQMFVDSEVLRRSEPYTPLLTGTLIKTGILGTELGSGLVQWIAPYAARQYYSPRKPGSVTGPLRGPFWFERMKAVWKERIIEGAKRIAGGGV